MLELEPELARGRAAAPRPSARPRRPSVAPPAFSMKFACRSEMTAPPIRCPFSPHASISAPAPRSPGGFLKTLPNVRFVVGCVAFRCASSSATVRLDLLDRPRLEPEAHLRDDLAGREPRVAVREVELGRRRACARRRRRRRPRRSSTARQSLPYAPAFMRTPPPAVPGIARGELEAAEPGVARAVQADRVRRAAAGDEHRPVDVRLGQLAGEPQHERVDAARRARAGSSRARSSRPRRPLRAPSASSSTSSASVARPREEPRRPAGAERRVARERNAFLDRRGRSIAAGLPAPAGIAGPM